MGFSFCYKYELSILMDNGETVKVTCNDKEKMTKVLKRKAVQTIDLTDKTLVIDPKKISCIVVEELK